VCGGVCVCVVFVCVCSFLCVCVMFCVCLCSVLCVCVIFCVCVCVLSLFFFFVFSPPSHLFVVAMTTEVRREGSGGSCPAMVVEGWWAWPFWTAGVWGRERDLVGRCRGVAECVVTQSP